MIKIYDKNFDISKVLNREIQSYGEYEQSVKKIVDDVRARGDEALAEYTLKFDGAALEALEVSEEEIVQAKKEVSAEFLRVLGQAKENIEFFHRRQLKEGFEIKQPDGTVLGQKYTPVERAGIYVPGGTASYPSTVLMNAVPAKIAGVDEIIMCTPPSKDGKIKAEILAAASLAGVDRIFKCGGAQAIAAMAYGTQTIPQVYKIVGPGNIFVALAKRQVFGAVSIDMIAGPSEILVIADKTANPVFLAADMLSQAEHDRLATAALITDSLELAQKTAEEIQRQLALLPRRDIAAQSVETNGKIIVVDNLDAAAEVSNAIAPEHLEICVDNPFDYLGKIKNAGSIFLGKYTPEALGDYYAGPNHTLPTGGSAKFSSPLSVDDFVKKSSYIYYTKEALGKVKDDVALFASREGLYAHAKSALIRFEVDGNE